MGHLFKKASRPFLAPYNEICFYLVFFCHFGFFLAISYFIHQIMVVKVGHLFKKAPKLFWQFLAIWAFFFFAISYLIHQFMVKVGHLEFSKAPGCLINVTRAEVLLEQENNLFDQVLDRAQAPADPPNIVQSD